MIKNKIILMILVIFLLSTFVTASFGSMLDTLNKDDKKVVFNDWKEQCNKLKGKEKQLCKFNVVEEVFNSNQEPETNYYDDFSGETLDLNKWIETYKNNLPFSDEHFVDVNEEVYHVAQYTTRDSSAQLIPTKDFLVGEVLEFDIFYNSGSGNNLAGFSRIIVNGNRISLQSYLDSCSTVNSGCGVIGNWNQVTDIGNQVGKYHIKMEFLNNGILMTTTRPDNTVIQHNYVGLNAPYKPLFTAQTGHNGLIHVDYDNFVVN